MTLYEVTKTYGKGRGENTMWDTVAIVSSAIEKSMDEKDKECLVRRVYEMMTGGHYDEYFANKDVSEMYYIDKNGNRHNAPYWSESDVKAIYDRHAGEIKEYNFWDFWVTMNLVASDNWCKLMKWFPNITDAEMNEKITEEAINWLKDDDWPTKNKAWDYLN